MMPPLECFTIVKKNAHSQTQFHGIVQEPNNNSNHISVNSSKAFHSYNFFFDFVVMCV